MDEIDWIARTYDLVVIEDACQSPGAEYKGRKTGTLGDMGAFSLNVTKNLSGAEGGLLVTEDDELAERAGLLRMFGEHAAEFRGKARPYISHTIGWNYRTQELPAAFARSQLRRLDQYNLRARTNGEYLSQNLEEIQGLEPPFVPDYATSTYHKYRVRLKPEELGLDMAHTEFRDKLLAALRAEGVSVTLWHVTPLPAYPLFQSKEGYGKGCPWSCPFYGQEIQYEADEYPEAKRLLDSSLIVGEEAYPLYIQDPELMEFYVQAFHKVFECIDEVISLEIPGLR
jgi:dTDP-4-amino-4,6-dideoxygalactose transaminase